MAYVHRVQPAPEPGKLTVTVNCHVCRKDQVFEVPEAGYRQWRDRGAFIQNALPTVDIAHRELLISGTCGPCFDKMWKEED